MDTIRRLKFGEADLYRQVRLASLLESPEAFATSYDSAAQRDLKSWTAQADGSAEGEALRFYEKLGFQRTDPTKYSNQITLKKQVQPRKAV